MPSASSGTDVTVVQHGGRYLAGAGLCAVVSNALLVGIDALRAPLVAGVLLSWLGSGVAGYLWHSAVTYRQRRTVPAFVRFMGGAFLGIPLAWAALWLFRQKLAQPMWIAAPAATVAMFCFHYLNAFFAIRWARLTQGLRRRRGRSEAGRA